MDTIKKIIDQIWNLSADQITIISLLITLLIFVLGKRSENRIKIYETRKEEYRKLIQFFQKIFSLTDTDYSKIASDKQLKKDFLDASLY